MLSNDGSTSFPKSITTYSNVLVASHSDDQNASALPFVRTVGSVPSFSPVDDTYTVLFNARFLSLDETNDV